jgi:hypothetical protein
MVEAWLSGNDVEPGAKINSPTGLLCAKVTEEKIVIAIEIIRNNFN